MLLPGHITTINLQAARENKVRKNNVRKRFSPFGEDVTHHTELPCSRKRGGALRPGGRPPTLRGKPPLRRGRPSLRRGRPPLRRGRPPLRRGRPPLSHGRPPLLRRRRQLLRRRAQLLRRRPQLRRKSSVKCLVLGGFLRVRRPTLRVAGRRCGVAGRHVMRTSTRRRRDLGATSARRRRGCVGKVVRMA